MITYAQRLGQLLDSLETNYEYLEPSVWSEKHRKLTSDISTVGGPFKYKNTPYTREIIDTLSPSSPAKVIGIMKGSQSGLTEGLVVNGLAWMIANEPGNTLFLSANDTLSQEMVESRLDQALQSCGIHHLIRPNVIRKRNSRTGDTSKSKEFAGGRIYAGGLQSIDKLSRQRSIRYGFFDDWDAAQISDKDQGNLFSLIQKRFSTAKNVMKQYYISTPETRPSNIETVYLMGDQRKWHVPCPCCGEFIEILWFNEKEKGKKYGINFEKDDDGVLIAESVRYVCQKCGDSFEEKEKFDMNLNGIWVPTAKPQREGYQSYYLSNLTSASFMYGWKDFAEEWIDIYKDGNEKKSKLKVFYNQTLGLPWEDRKEQIQKNKLQMNTRNYPIGIVPNNLSKKDGNGEILILTCACDLNGVLEDGRLEYEVVGHCENGSTYSIDAGSIGTYNGRKGDEDREIWTYKNEAYMNIWDHFFDTVINRKYQTDDEREMKIILTGVDTGYLATFAYYFIDSHPQKVVGVMGRGEDKFKKNTGNYKRFAQRAERKNSYMLEVDLYKDDLSEYISLNWNEKKGESQHPGFMNFPEPSEGKYTGKDYFKQYEAEQKVIEHNEDGEPIGWKWKRKHSSAPNHFMDCRVYNYAIRDLFADMMCREAGLKKSSWADFVELAKKMMGI